MSTSSTPITTNNTAKPTPSTAATAAKPKRHLGLHLLAGGIAGCCEALTCHPLDTIKVRLQLRGERMAKMPKVVSGVNGAAAAKPIKQNFLPLGVQIIRKEGPFALYKGLGAVISGIVPKMAIRFSSFEFYKELLQDSTTKQTSSAGVFIAGLGAGVTESILVVTPMDVVKIRLQAQFHSMTDPLDIPKYRNAPHCAYVMIKEEGLASLYKGVGLTALRQSTNQAANFTVYQYLKKTLQDLQPSPTAPLPSYQTLMVGFISGACGPLFNAPIDTIKTRIQKNPSKEKGFTRFLDVTNGIIKNEGYLAFYKGLTPRVLRVAPGQAVTFAVYEVVYGFLTDMSKKISVAESENVGVSATHLNDE